MTSPFALVAASSVIALPFPGSAPIKPGLHQIWAAGVGRRVAGGADWR